MVTSPAAGDDPEEPEGTDEAAADDAPQVERINLGGSIINLGGSITPTGTLGLRVVRNDDADGGWPEPLPPGTPRVSNPLPGIIRPRGVRSEVTFGTPTVLRASSSPPEDGDPTGEQPPVGDDGASAAIAASFAAERERAAQAALVAQIAAEESHNVPTEPGEASGDNGVTTSGLVSSQFQEERRQGTGPAVGIPAARMSVDGSGGGRDGRSTGGDDPDLRDVTIGGVPAPATAEAAVPETVIWPKPAEVRLVVPLLGGDRAGTDSPLAAEEDADGGVSHEASATFEGRGALTGEGTVTSLPTISGPSELTEDGFATVTPPPLELRLETYPPTVSVSNDAPVSPEALTPQVDGASDPSSGDVNVEVPGERVEGFTGNVGVNVTPSADMEFEDRSAEESAQTLTPVSGIGGVPSFGGRRGSVPSIPSIGGEDGLTLGPLEIQATVTVTPPSAPDVAREEAGITGRGEGTFPRLTGEALGTVSINARPVPDVLTPEQRHNEEVEVGGYARWVETGQVPTYAAEIEERFPALRLDAFSAYGANAIARTTTRGQRVFSLLILAHWGDVLLDDANPEAKRLGLLLHHTIDDLSRRIDLDLKSTTATSKALLNVVKTATSETFDSVTYGPFRRLGLAVLGVGRAYGRKWNLL